jgi:hypothetical protein
MTSKLTAKLSDGTEWEVYHKWTADGPGWVRCSLKPLKPSPPKEVWANVYPDLGYGYHYKTLKEAEKNLEPSGSTHRYVLAEESKEEKPIYNEFNFRHSWLNPKFVAKPQPREWWDVRFMDGTAGTTWTTGVSAKDWAAKENERLGYQCYEVVHVREVLDEGPADKSRVYHLQFRKNGKLLRVLGPIENGQAALLFEDQEHKDEYAHEVVRVRQSKL